MPVLQNPTRLEGAFADSALFGGNVLAPRAEGQAPGTFINAVEGLGVGALRYPGGALTENLFDISNPDASEVTDIETGETVAFLPLSDFMEFAASTGRGVNLVIPTRTQLSDDQTDDDGNRFADVDEETLRGFVRDVVTGEYGDADVLSLEIGNEYWGSGRMNALEYGRVSSRMTDIIDQELTALDQEAPGAADTAILVQLGQNYNFSSLDEQYADVPNDEALADLNETYGLTLTEDEAVYGSGRINWQFVNNQIIKTQFETDGTLDQIDGIATHVYSKAPDLINSRYTDISQLERSWLEDRPDLMIHVTEWNQKANTGVYEEGEDFGLYQSHEMLNMVEGFMRGEVDQAQVWPLLQNTENSLSIGPEFDQPTPPGEMFRMMNETLPGKASLDFRPDDRESEAQIGDVDVHGFAGGGDLVFYIASNSRDEVTNTDIDVSPLVADVESVSARILGVADGDAPGSTRSEAIVEEVNAAEMYQDGFIETILAPGEIMEVEMQGVTPTEAFAPLFEQTLDGGTEGDPGPDPDPGEGPGEGGDGEGGDEGDDEGDAVAVDDGGGGDLGALGGLLALLALAGLGA